MEPRALVPVVVLGSVLAQLASIHHIRPHMKMSRAGPLLLGGVIATPVGVAALSFIDVITFKTGVGVVLLVYCSFMLSERGFPRVSGGGRLLDGAIGCVAGLMGGASGLQGPPMIVWCALRGWEAAEQRATYQSFFIVTQSLMFLLLWAAGIADRSHLKLVVMLAPVVIAASVLGTWLSRRLGERQFAKTVHGFLWISGLLLVIPFISSKL